MRFKLKIGEKNFEIEILERETETVVRVGEKEFSFKEERNNKVKTERKISLEKSDLKKEILAPISGIITEIFIKEGDLVEKDQKLLILSAMKMENEIFSETEGKIKKIFVKKGEKVEKNQKLILLE